MVATAISNNKSTISKRAISTQPYDLYYAGGQTKLAS